LVCRTKDLNLSTCPSVASEELPLVYFPWYSTPSKSLWSNSCLLHLVTGDLITFQGSSSIDAQFFSLMMLSFLPVTCLQWQGKSNHPLQCPLMLWHILPYNSNLLKSQDTFSYWQILKWSWPILHFVQGSSPVFTNTAPPCSETPGYPGLVAWWFAIMPQNFVPSVIQKS
jgi:hypothetical protein